MCDSDKANLARGYLDHRSSDKVPTEGLLLWLDAQRTTGGTCCYTRHRSKGDRIRAKYVDTTSDSRGNFFQCSEGLNLLEGDRSARTLFIVHSDDPEERVEAGDEKAGDFFRYNGGRLRRKLQAQGKSAQGGLRITCCIMVAYGKDHPDWDVAVTRELLVYNRVLSHDEIIDVESYLSEQWKVKLKDIPEDEALLDAKRVDFLIAFYPSLRVIWRV